MGAQLHCAKARLRDGVWYHPSTGQKIGESDGEIFVIYAKDIDTGGEIISFMVDRTCLEQVEDGVRKALTIEPVSIRRA